VEPTFLTGANATFIAELYDKYLADPSSVDPQWAAFFRELRDDPEAVHKEARGPSWADRGVNIIETGRDESGEGDAPAGREAGPRAAENAVDDPEVRACTLDSVRALMLIRAYRVRGHLMAHTDPLGLHPPEGHPELDYRTYGFTEADLDREIFIDHVLGLEKATLRHILEVVQDTYCGTIGVEFTHIQDPEQKSWVQRRIENIRNHAQFTANGKRAILERLTEAEGFERFLQAKYTGTKRFGLEGAEAVVPALEQILKRGSQLGVEEVVLGMSHRGRLTVLTNVLHKPFSAVFSEFQGNSAYPDDVQGSGDVKYHLGTSADRTFDDRTIHVSLQANPSHLEAVDPVVLGRVRAKQEQLGDETRERAMGLLLHGDAAFAGQGVVAECLELSHLRGYRTGGTMHVIVNNQIGFTTSPHYARSGQYATDVAKKVQAPIFHVNGDDPEAVVHMARIATEFRQQFQTDVVLDVVCYRRHGHNESDEPAFTQPSMYRLIRDHPTVRQIYTDHLVAQNQITRDETEEINSAFQNRLEEAFQAADSYRPNRAEWLQGVWEGLVQFTGEEELRQDPTEVPAETLRAVGRAMTTWPEAHQVNRKLARQLQGRRDAVETGTGIDWATAEHLAIGSLLVEGTPVRLSGQDSGRGTFSQRHAVLVDQETEHRYVPLNHLGDDQARFEVVDSPLSELAILGYEYGYSLAEPMALTMWEAQFGDFANGAQVIIDQFIASAESKWLRMSGLVMLLPHGYEGQGPEHSSARPERYLQLCAEDNMIVCNLTTPANYFHALRRQVRRNFRKPLVVFTPKSLLRHKQCVSDLADMAEGSRFCRVMPDPETGLAADDRIRRVVLCTGKVYYDLSRARREEGVTDVAIVRVEQLYPWPKDTLKAQLARYPNAEVVWCQEEPANMGYWTFVDRRIEYALEEMGHRAGRALYVGRPAAASPATGVYSNHVEEQKTLVENALNAPAANLRQPFRRVTHLSEIGT